MIAVRTNYDCSSLQLYVAGRVQIEQRIILHGENSEEWTFDQSYYRGCGIWLPGDHPWPLKIQSTRWTNRAETR